MLLEVMKEVTSCGGPVGATRTGDKPGSTQHLYYNT